ncbi:MAG: DUF7507 domain-containing protein, partial [Candidatus Thorarchaeota archaeon]
MKRRAILALAVSLAVFVTFGYGFNPNMTTNLVTVGQLDAIESRYVTSSDASVWTDKPDYLPGEIVTISGSEFLTDSSIEINVTRPDATVDTGSTTSDATGSFVYYYDLNGIMGLYNVTATDGVNIANTTFTDAVHVDFSQYANLDEKWVGSILGGSNSLYYEGMSVPQRILFVDIVDRDDDDILTLTFSHMATKSGIHAYDWLTGWDQGNDPILDPLPWGEDIGPHATPAIAQALHEAVDEYEIFVEVPDDGFISSSYEIIDNYQYRIDAYEAVWGNREIRICGNHPILSASFVSLTHNPASDDTGDSYIEYVLTWESASDQIMIELGGHLAVSGSPNNNPVAWGTSLGASVISGGSYHFKLNELDEYSLGSQDNQIKGEAIEPADADLAIVKRGPATALVGEEITYEFEITNLGPADALNVLVTDNLFLDPIPLTGLTDEDGDGDADDLAAGATVIVTANYVVPEPGNDPMPNTALVSSTTPDLYTENNQDGHEVDILRTGVRISKDGEPQAHVGQEIEYVVTIENIDEADLYFLTISDSLVGDLMIYTIEGDFGIIGVLDYGEIWTIRYTYTVKETDFDPLTNTVTVSGRNFYGQDLVTDLNDWSVEILKPNILLTKIATDGLGSEITQAYIGDTITYVFKIENTGDADLTGVILDDITSICDGIIARDSDEIGNNDDILEPGEIWVFFGSHLVTLDDPDPLTNNAYAEGTDALLETVSSTDDATVDILHDHGTLSIDKQGPEFVIHGQTVTYYVYVSYTSADNSPAL